ncbi:hypothetical protein KYB31_15620 [Clostridium felsineum]|uniref:hypothetical protein n=1 Tax=Clostridium felsineum TaxID=36839 RepID=UPI00214D9ABA|nr:hypothetical protein [Clostridium felsineum]MCR3760406.1 hypothetical protein [Clostridium felsineum]
MDNYVCFYTITPFWAGEAPNKDDLEYKANVIYNSNMFTETLSKIEFMYENDEIYFAVCKDGLIMTKLKKLDSRREDIIKQDHLAGSIRFMKTYLKYLNSIQLILSSAVLKKESHICLKNFIIRTGEAFGFSIGSEGIGSGVPTGSTSQYLNGRYSCYYRHDIPINMDNRILMRKSIKEEVFKVCFKDINIVIKNIEAIQILNQFNSALSEYKNLNFIQSIIQSWCIIENYINKLFYEYLLRIDISAKRKIEEKNNTAFKKIEFLKNNQIIINDKSKKMNSVRRNRNKILHKFYSNHKEVTYNDCADALELVKDIINKVYGLDLEVSYGLAFNTL